MSITKEVSIFCDRCGNWAFGECDITNRKMRSIAKKEGWAVRTGPRTQDLCPACLASKKPESKGVLHLRPGDSYNFRVKP